MHAWLNLVVIISMDLQPIRPVEFGCKFIEIEASKAFTLYACLVKFGGHNLNGFTPNLTG